MCWSLSGRLVGTPVVWASNSFLAVAGSKKISPKLEPLGL
jgi:hypothetical protein